MHLILGGFYGDAIFNLKTFASALLVPARALLGLSNAFLVHAITLLVLVHAMHKTEMTVYETKCC